MSEKKTVKETAAKKDTKKDVKKDTKKEVKKEVAPKEAPSVKAEIEKAESADFSGKYIKAIGRRKTAVAQVRLYQDDAKGIVMVNGVKLNKYFNNDLAAVATQSMKAAGHVRDINVSIIVKGGGQIGQVEAIRHGIARAILALDAATHDILRTNGFLTRDYRQKERKKPGLRGARKRPQWSKR
jgi:small subunit ribosomal protein S9